MTPRPPIAPRDDEESSQARELAAYERRQQQRRPSGPFRGPGWVPGARPAPPTGGGFRTGGTGGFRAPSPGGFRPAGGGFRPGGPARPMGGAGMRGGMRRPGGAQYTEQIRRATAGPRAQAAPSHEAGDPIAGPHAVLEALRAGRTIKRLFISNERGTQTGPVQDLINEAQQRRIFVRFVDPMEISRISPIESHQGVVAIAEGKPGVELDEFLEHLDGLNEAGLVLLIDSLQDPQNFGVLLRSAEATGVDGVVIPKHRAVGLTPAVAKTSAGASEHLMIAEVANLRQAIDAIKEKGIWVVGTDETGDLLYDEVDYRGPTALVIGGESEGIRRLVLEGCDQVVRIPMEGQIESLNAAAAGTVVLYEALRQRRRNVPPSDTRTPAPVRTTAVTPQEEGMDYISDAGDRTDDGSMDQDEREDGEIASGEERENGELLTGGIVDEEANGEPRGDDLADGEEGADAPAEEAVAETAPTKKRAAPRAKKAPVAKKPAPRKKTAE
ncbi:MAG TPA: 23S rRNA (guanosine(2251)-2'-O)-methyltransferase RlmB [Candidatus Limnocylindrales bacterium]|nr:23S rRNA (guanosine(2251)-2'-O)-methyltransferase RlmB [Candidatus Limnocylindrales bacterium]